MKALLNLGKRFLTDEKAAEITELGIVLALVVAGSVAAITVIGNTIHNAYRGVAIDLFFTGI